MVANQDTLMPIPGPPHDPTWWLLNARLGWHEADPGTDKVDLPGDGALTLMPLPASLRSLTEPSGSFGGLVPPTNVALGPDGSVFLLERG